MRTVLEDHIGWLADQPRMAALRRAVAASVRAGDVVVDMGSGTGVLAFMACEAGAARVYAIERGPIIGLARKLAHVNGYDARITFIRAPAEHAVLPETVDVVLTDLIGEFAFDVGLFELFVGARRWLKPTGRTIPAAVSLSLAAIELPRLRQQLQLMTERPGGFDMTPLAEHARKTVYRLYPAADALISTPAPVAHFQLPTDAVPTIHARATLHVTRAGMIDAIAGWFDAELAPGVRMTNAPAAADRIDRSVIALPVSPPIAVVDGDEVEIDFRLLARDHVFSWRVCRRRSGDPPHMFAGSTLEGALLSLEDLERHHTHS